MPGAADQRRRHLLRCSRLRLLQPPMQAQPAGSARSRSSLRPGRRPGSPDILPRSKTQGPRGEAARTAPCLDHLAPFPIDQHLQECADSAPFTAPANHSPDILPGYRHHFHRPLPLIRLKRNWIVWAVSRATHWGQSSALSGPSARPIAAFSCSSGRIGLDRIRTPPLAPAGRDSPPHGTFWRRASRWPSCEKPPGSTPTSSRSW
jgi:hypothetical protein